MQLLLSRKFYSFITVLLFSTVLFSQQAVFNLGNFNPNTQTFDVLYEFSEDVAGYQFDVNGVTLDGNASGGISESLSFSVNAGVSTVLGFSFSGVIIPAGSGVLTTLSYSEITADELSKGKSATLWFLAKYGVMVDEILFIPAIVVIVELGIVKKLVDVSKLPSNLAPDAAALDVKEILIL